MMYMKHFSSSLILHTSISINLYPITDYEDLERREVAVKKVYQMPEIEITTLFAEDILTGSNGNGGNQDDGFEWN